MVTAVPGPVNVQLALQGGGAKICLLVAALEAIQALQQEALVKVTRIAGTSAGAIVGTLFAAGVNMSVVKERLKKLSPEQLRKLFPKPSKLGLFSRLVLQGKPLWPDRHLKDILDDLFADVKDVSTFRDVGKKKGIQVMAVAANLTDGRKIVYQDEDTVISSLLSSCGLPYCFRTWTDSGNVVVVDGGICENLPSEELEKYEKDGGLVVGITFSSKQSRSIDGIVDFSMALLDTAMANSEERARRRLGDRVFSIDTDIRTFDFELAAREGFGDKYELTKIRAEKFFRDYVDSQRRGKSILVGDPWSTQSMSMMEALGKVFKAHHAHVKCSYSRCSMIVQANSLLQPGEPDYGTPDKVHYWMEFRTLEDPIYCRAFSVSYAQHPTLFEGTTFQLSDLTTKRTVAIIDVPMRDPSHPDRRPLVLFFDPCLPSQAGPYRLDFRDNVENLMKPLLERGIDEMVLNPENAQGPVGRLDLVLWLPSRYRKVRMQPKNNAAGGRLLTSVEIDEMQFDAPADFQPIGWTIQELQPGQQFGVDIILGESPLTFVGSGVHSSGSKEGRG